MLRFYYAALIHIHEQHEHAIALKFSSNVSQPREVRRLRLGCGECVFHAHKTVTEGAQNLNGRALRPELLFFLESQHVHLIIIASSWNSWHGQLSPFIPIAGNAAFRPSLGADQTLAFHFVNCKIIPSSRQSQRRSSGSEPSRDRA